MRKNFIAGKWQVADQAIEVRHPYNNEVFDEVPAATEADALKALDAATKAANHCRALGGYQRYLRMLKAADLLASKQEEFARAITMETGKPLTEAKVEVGRAIDIVRLGAFEGTQLRGDQLPFESAGNGASSMGFTLRIPVGIVVAITPFNFPLMLALHKVVPALATGSAVILKPASVTPVSSVMLTELFHEAGFDGDILQLITGPGATVGAALVADPRPRKVSFTGSSQVGLQLATKAGLKKLSLELGSNCTMVVLPDADLEEVARHVAIGGYANAGQVCISLQRVVVDKSVYGDFLDAAKGQIEQIKVGAPLEEDTKLASMIEDKEAARVEDWVAQAASSGARVLTGGKRAAAVMEPTLVADVTDDMKLVRDEVFGPVVSAMAVDGIDAAVAAVNSSQYGLAASIFTTNVKHAMRFARDAEAGTVQINWSPQWRADFMPYGGFKGSGIGKEGMRAACLEMTEEKVVALHGIEPYQAP